MNELFEFEYNALQEMLIVNHQEGFSYNMSYEDDVFSVATKLNEQQTIISRLEEENEQLQKEKEYYREYALKYLLEYDLYTDNFLNDIKDIIGEEGVKRIKEKQNKIIEALKKEGLYE